MTGSDQTDQLRNKTKQFAIGILKLCGPLPKTPETLARLLKMYLPYIA